MKMRLSAGPCLRPHLIDGGWGGVTGSAPGDAELTPNNSLPIPDQLDASYHWLAQTQRMLNRGEARVRHIDYENAPFGRTVLTPSPYRWWLGFLAWCEHLATGAPPSTLVEKAALLADPLLWGIIILGSAILAAKCFGSLSAYLVCRLLLEKKKKETFNEKHVSCLAYAVFSGQD